MNWDNGLEDVNEETISCRKTRWPVQYSPITVVRIMIPRMTEVMTMPTVSTRGPSLVSLPAWLPLKVSLLLPPSQKVSSRVTRESLAVSKRSGLAGLSIPGLAGLKIPRVPDSNAGAGTEVRGSSTEEMLDLRRVLTVVLRVKFKGKMGLLMGGVVVGMVVVVVVVGRVVVVVGGASVSAVAVVPHRVEAG